MKRVHKFDWNETENETKVLVNRKMKQKRNEPQWYENLN